MSLESGTTLGPYQIDAPLGAGGMGEVYKATDTRLDRTAAVPASFFRHSQSAARHAKRPTAGSLAPIPPSV